MLVTSKSLEGSCAHTSISLSLAPTGLSMNNPPMHNTAPVIEHRCLYTHDIRRKAKRWQDGILRFHTFNKRVMVYDIPRNYIGDTHWREGNTIQDGDELELDKPIIVQVCDQIATVEQDLTGLLEKRKKKDVLDDETAHLSRPSPTLSVTGSAAGSFKNTPLQPKSLNALLGKPAGKHGRAVLPTVSLHETRVSTAVRQAFDSRPSKRQCMDNSHTGVNILAQKRARGQIGRKANAPPRIREGHPSDPALIQSQQTSKGGNKRRSQQAASVSEQLSSNLPRSSHPATTASKAGQITRSSTPREDRRSNQRPPQVIDNSKERMTTQRRDGHVKEVAGQFSTSVGPESHENENSRPRSRLQVATRKPRRKLMYRDLLSQHESLVGRNAILELTCEKSSAQPNSTVVPHGRLRHRSGSGESVTPENEHSIIFESMALDEVSVANQEESPSANTGNDSTGFENDFISTASVTQSLTEPKKTPHDSTLTLERMDAILLSPNQETAKQAFPAAPERSAIEDLADLPFSASLSLGVSSCAAGPSVAESNARVPSPPPVLPASRSAHHELDGRRIVRNGSCRLDDSAPSSPSFDDSCDGNILRDKPPHANKPSPKKPPALVSSASLPAFARPNQIRHTRSPLKTSMSETAMDRHPDRRRNLSANPSFTRSSAQSMNAWSKEAWDLFGCGRQGVSIPYIELSPN